MKEIFIILLSVILVDNFVLSKFLGICPFLGVSKKLDSAFGMSVAVTFVMLIATITTWPIYTYLLHPNDLGYLQTVVFILIIAAVVQLVEIVLKKYVVSLHKSLGVYLPLITTNCAVLGLTMLNVESSFSFAEKSNGLLTFPQAIVNSLGAGLGFMLAMVLFSGVRSRIEKADIPKSFKGIPATLIAASIVSVSFMGFSGLIDGIFK